MNRTILILATVALVVAGAAFLSTQSRRALTAADAPAEGTLFPALDGHVNDVVEVQVTGADGSFTLERSGDAWGAADKGGYPIDFGKVKGLVVAIANFDLIEAKTANAAYHEKLGVQEPGTPESESSRVTLKDAAGKVLADVIVGQARSSRGGQPSLYARRAGEDQTYEVEGRLFVDTNASSWLDRKILELKQERVASVVVTHPDGERLTISREAPEQADFAVADLPEGRELLWEGVARSVASAAQSLSLEDVGGSELLDFASVPNTVAEFRTFDGLVVTATTAQQDDKTYLKIAARAEPIAGPEPLPAAEPASPAEDQPAAAAGDETAAAAEPAEGSEDAEAAPGETAAAEPEAEKPPQKTFEEVSAEADAINAKVANWVYVVPSWSATNLRKRQSELLKPLEPETPPDAAIDELSGEDAPPLDDAALQELLQGLEQAPATPPPEDGR